MTNGLFDSSIPMGLGMALAQNTKALDKFSSMTQAQKQSIIAGTHAIQSKQEMRSYVDKIANGTVG